MIYDNNIWLSDIDKVSTVIPELENMEGKSILITGAAGLICSSVVDILFPAFVYLEPLSQRFEYHSCCLSLFVLVMDLYYHVFSPFLCQPIAKLKYVQLYANFAITLHRSFLRFWKTLRGQRGSAP